jgi:ferric-dicitrate binding protein FerR (iron transport regulator)
MPTDPRSPDDASLLERYFLGLDTPEDALDLQHIFDADPTLRTLVEEMRASSFEPDRASFDVDALKSRIDARIADAQDPHGAAADPIRPRLLVLPASRSPRFHPARVLLALGAALAAGTMFVVGTRRHASEAVTRTYATRSGVMSTFELADGSHVTLAPRTTLTVRSGARDNAQDVTLTGEAHFDVAANSHAPFVVHAGLATTRVLGTTFDVRRYAGDAAGQVRVQSGKVSTQAYDHTVTVTAGMTARFTDSAVSASASLPTAYTDWTRGQLVFHDAPVPVLLETLQRWYGYEILLTDSTLMTRHVSAEFPIGEAGEMLRYLKHVLGVTLTFDDSVITLHPPRRETTRILRSRTPVWIPGDSTVTEVGR